MLKTRRTLSWVPPAFKEVEEQMFGTLIDIQVAGINTAYNECQEKTRDLHRLTIQSGRKRLTF